MCCSSTKGSLSLNPWRSASVASFCGIGRDLPTWSQALLVVSHDPFAIGIFASTKPWMPRHKDQRFLAVGPATIHPNETPEGGSPLKPLLKSMATSMEDAGVVVLAGEADGHRAVNLHGGGEGWTVVVASDAWVAVGPKASWPEFFEIGPHMLQAPHGARVEHRDPSSSGLGDHAVLQFRIKA